MIRWFLSWQGFMDIIWLLFLAGLLWYFWQERQASLRASHWLIARGRITQLLWTRDGVHVWPKIEYTWQLYEQEFKGEYFFPDTLRNNPNSKYARKVAYRAAMAFEKDEEINIFYNPDNPLQSALDVRIPRKLNVIIGLLLGFLLLHLVVIAHHLHR